MEILVTNYSPLEFLLLSALLSLVGAVIILAKWFHSYMIRTNDERREEIKSSVKVLTKLEGTIEKNNFLVEQLPDRLQDKIQAVLKK